VADARLIQPLRAKSVDEASQRVPLLLLGAPHSQGGKNPRKYSSRKTGRRKRNAGAATFISSRIEKVTVVVPYPRNF
jgi:hypothetical protein